MLKREKRGGDWRRVPRESCPSRGGSSPSRTRESGNGQKSSCTRAGASGLGDSRKQTRSVEKVKEGGPWLFCHSRVCEKGTLTCSVGRWRSQGASGKRSPLRDSGGFWLLRGKPGGPRHGLERGYSTPDRGQGSHEPGTRSLKPLVSPSVPRPVWDSRKETFSGFFSPLLPQFWRRPRPLTSPHSWGRVTWSPKP